MPSDRDERFSRIGYEDFRRMATDPSLSPTEKAGFPDAYRAGKEAAILRDILSKASVLTMPEKTVLDIGPGCSGLALAMIEHCRKQDHNLLLVDSEEMLAQLPSGPGITKFAAYYPECPALINAYQGRIDCVICYSVLHYIFAESNVWRFFDASLALLREGGQFLLGDIPNVSKRKRFFSSRNGIEFHKQFMKTDKEPSVQFNIPEPGLIDDSVVIALIQRARLQGFDAYIVPQEPELPMANRREDILITRP